MVVKKSVYFFRGNSCILIIIIGGVDILFEWNDVVIFNCNVNANN